MTNLVLILQKFSLEIDSAICSICGIFKCVVFHTDQNHVEKKEINCIENLNHFNAFASMILQNKIQFISIANAITQTNLIGAKTNVIRISVLTTSSKRLLIIFTMICSVIIQYKYRKTKAPPLSLSRWRKTIDASHPPTKTDEYIGYIVDVGRRWMWIVCSVFSDRKFSLLKQHNNNNNLQMVNRKNALFIANENYGEAIFHNVHSHVHSGERVSELARPCRKHRIQWDDVNL